MKASKEDKEERDGPEEVKDNAGESSKVVLRLSKKRRGEEFFIKCFAVF